ncbi:MAG TPA: hypothetical protein PLO95_03340 [Spirochaetota bacterium]|nr:hypothetical protein [Spirochaetota bacterium]
MKKSEILFFSSTIPNLFLTDMQTPSEYDLKALLKFSSKSILL